MILVLNRPVTSDVSRKLMNIISLKYHTVSFLFNKHPLYFPLYNKNEWIYCIFILNLAKRENYTRN